MKRCDENLLAYLKYLSNSQRACSMFLSDSGFPRKAGKILPSRLKADDSPSGVQIFLSNLVNFSSPYDAS